MFSLLRKLVGGIALKVCCGQVLKTGIPGRH